MANKTKYPQGCGIYAIENMQNGKRYVGSSRNMERRIKAHVWQLRNDRHHSAHLQAAWGAYGEEAFCFISVMRCGSEDDLLAAERLEIEMHNSVENGYNMTSIPESPMRGKKHSDETRAKMRAARANRPPISEETRERHRASATEREQQKRESGFEVSVETRRKLSEAGKGREVSVETRSKISAANSGIALTKEHRQKLSAAHAGMVLTEEHRAAISRGLAGRIQSEETRKKLSEKHAGKVMSQEAREKMRKAKLKYWEERKIFEAASLGVSHP